MDAVVFEVRSLLRMRLEITRFPELASKSELIQKGIAAVKKRFPGIIAALSKEKVLSELKRHTLEIRCATGMDEKHVRRAFMVWLGRQRVKRLLFVIGEAMILPFAVLLSVIPGPNVLVYLVLVALYFHFRSWLALNGTHAAALKLRIICDTD